MASEEHVAGTTYQWFTETKIEGATSHFYTPSSEHDIETIKVIVTDTKKGIIDSGTNRSYTLTEDDVDASLYVEITSIKEGATNHSYVLTSDDVGKSMFVTVSETSEGGSVNNILEARVMSPVNARMSSPMKIKYLGDAMDPLEWFSDFPEEGYQLLTKSDTKSFYISGQHMDLGGANIAGWDFTSFSGCIISSPLSGTPVNLPDSFRMLSSSIGQLIIGKGIQLTGSFPITTFVSGLNQNQSYLPDNIKVSGSIVFGPDLLLTLETNYDDEYASKRRNINLKNHVMKGMRIDNFGYIENLNAEYAQMQNCVFTGHVEFHSCNFRGADLSGISFEDINSWYWIEYWMNIDDFEIPRELLFDSCSFANTNLSNVTFSNVDFGGSSFVGTKFIGSTMLNANFENCRFTNADFTNANFADTNMKNCTLSNCKIDGAKFPNELLITQQNPQRCTDRTTVSLPKGYDLFPLPQPVGSAEGLYYIINYGTSVLKYKNSDFSDGNFTGLVMRTFAFTGSSAKFNEALFTRANFSSVQLNATDMDFTDAVFQGLIFNSEMITNKVGSNFTLPDGIYYSQKYIFGIGINFVDVSFGTIDMSNMVLESTRFENCDFTNSTGLNLSNMDGMIVGGPLKIPDTVSLPTEFQKFSAGVIKTAVVQQSGTGYTISDVLRSESDNKVLVRIRVDAVSSSGGVESFTILDFGMVYSVNDIITFETKNSGTAFSLKVTEIEPDMHLVGGNNIEFSKMKLFGFDFTLNASDANPVPWNNMVIDGCILGANKLTGVNLTTVIFNEVIIREPFEDATDMILPDSYNVIVYGNRKVFNGDGITIDIPHRFIREMLQSTKDLRGIDFGDFDFSSVHHNANIYDFGGNIVDDDTILTNATLTGITFSAPMIGSTDALPTGFRNVTIQLDEKDSIANYITGEGISYTFTSNDNLVSVDMNEFIELGNTTFDGVDVSSAIIERMDFTNVIFRSLIQRTPLVGRPTSATGNATYVSWTTD